MDLLQQTLSEAMASMPSRFLARQIAKRLREQGIRAPKALVDQVVEHVLSGNAGAFAGHDPTAGHVTFELTEADAEEVTRALADFVDVQLPNLIPEIASRVSKGVLKSLKSRWAAERSAQQAELSGFTARLEGRWGRALGQLRMLLTIAREWGHGVYSRYQAQQSSGPRMLRDILARLHVRACQVADEIICLLENGFADGAMARWRTLHEISVVATVLSRHGEPIAERYLAHQAVESKRALNKFLNCCPMLGYRPPSIREQRRITKAYDAVLARYGADFKSDYGWAAYHLNRKAPSFADLEAEAGRAAMRSHYQLGNDNVHAGVKSMFFRLGLMDRQDALLAGRSIAGLEEPGQNAAISLTQVSILVCLSEPNLDDLVMAEVMSMLMDAIPRSLVAADRKLRRAQNKGVQGASEGEPNRRRHYNRGSPR